MSHPLPKLDAIDRQLLQALQQNGRATVGELAEMVSLSPSPCWRRVKLLEESGLVEGYHARLSRRQLGYGVTGFVQLQMDNHTSQATEAGFGVELPTHGGRSTPVRLRDGGRTG